MTLESAAALEGVVAVAAGGQHSLALLDDGTVLAWGANDHGQLGDGTTDSHNSPVRVMAPDGHEGVLGDVTSISANSEFSMALRSDGTIVTWGKGDAGQRGIGDESAPLYPTTVRAIDGLGPLRQATHISADGRTELALLSDGRVVGWGANDYGMIGDGTTEDRFLPTPVLGVDGAGELQHVVQIAMGGQNGLALLNDGRVVTWGYNDKGQLGQGTTTSSRRPVFVKGPGGQGKLASVAAISAAEKHAFALRLDGTVVAWGHNSAGQLGDGTTSQREAPAFVAGMAGSSRLRDVQSIYAGEAYGVAVLGDGTPVSWGSGGKGQLASGDFVNRSRPGPLVMLESGHSVLGVAPGERHLLLLVD